MATVTKTYKENDGYPLSTWTIQATGSNVTATGSTVSIPVPTVQAKYVYSGKNTADLKISGIDINVVGAGLTMYTESVNYTVSEQSWGSNVNKSMTRSKSSLSVATNRLFNTNNKTSRTLNLSMSNGLLYGGSYNFSKEWEGYLSGVATGSFGTLATVTLNVPPTFTSDELEFDTPNLIYAGLTTASVDLSEITAYYGGYIVEAKLTIGNKSAVITGDATNILSSGTITMLLEEVGTFTPTITVTDSRGQTKTNSLSSITVLGYTSPSVSLSVQRTDNTGAIADEGNYAVVTGQFTFTDAIATLSQPAVTGATNVTWYEARNAQTGAIDLTSEVDWTDTSSFTTGVTLYALLGTFQPNESYVITVTPVDSQGTGTPMSVTLPTAFYTIDFLAGGHGIAFGVPATQEGVVCAMDFHPLTYIGFIQMFAGQTAPNGWLLCHGQAVSREDYAGLFDVIGTTYGAGDGSTTFNLPDMRDRFPVGAGSSYTLNSTGGANGVTLNTTQIPAHTHGSKSLSGTMSFGNVADATVGASGICSHAGGAHSGYTGNGANSRARAVFTVNATHEHTSVGGGQAHENRPPYIGVNYIIYAGI